METHLCECGEAQTAAHILIDCHLYCTDRETMLCVIELSFVKCNLPIHDRTLNLSSLLWPELSINQYSQIIISEVHKFLISTYLSFQIAINGTRTTHLLFVKFTVRVIIFIPESYYLRDQYWA